MKTTATDFLALLALSLCRINAAESQPPLTLPRPSDEGRQFREYLDLKRLKLEERRTVPWNSSRCRRPQPTQIKIAYNRAFDESEARAKKEFYWMADPTSPFFQRAQAIDTELKKFKIPLFDHPDKPYIIAHIVAHEAALRNAKAAITR
ncbi:MAG: hypothetical protein ACREH8_15625 [Opitutaceae bacterium]